MDYDNGEMDFLSGGMMGPSLTLSSPPISSASSDAVGLGVNYIVHPVSKFDTVAGIAIKYGVEVADIKRLNGLATDLQIFALKTLQIPLSGRHPPSPSLCNGHVTPQRPSGPEQTPLHGRHSDLFDSFQSLRLKSSSERNVSPATSCLQSYYGLRQPDRKGAADGFEMAVYQNGVAYCPGIGPCLTSSSHLNPPLSHQRKSKSVADDIMSTNSTLLDPLLIEESENSSSDRWIKRLSTRHQKMQTDFTSCPLEKVLKEESSSSGVISAITGKRLALRPKSASRAVSGGVDSESAGLNPMPLSLGGSFTTDNGVRKSSSTPSLRDSDYGALSSLWPTSKWNLKPDFQAPSSAAMPMFDGLPKPMSRRNKAALD